MLVGWTVIEDSLQRLDKLTQEEVHMAAAEALKIARGIDDQVKVMGDMVDDVDGSVQSVHTKLEDIDNELQCIDNEVQCVNDKVSLAIEGEVYLLSCQWPIVH
jgi:hypothetical protein